MEVTGEILFAIGVSAVLLVVGTRAYFAFRVFQPDPEMKKAWQEAAGQTGLTLRNPLFSLLRLDGTYEGRRVAVIAEPATMDPRARSYPAKTQYAVHHDRKGVPKLEVLYEGEKLLGENVELGVPQFDDHFQLSCDDAAFARALFDDAQWRERFLQLELPKVSLNAEEVSLSEIGTQRDTLALQDRLRLAAGLAERVSRI